MICDKCDGENSSDSLFCKRCGNPLGPPVSSPATGLPPLPGIAKDLSSMERCFGPQLKAASKQLGRDLGKPRIEFVRWCVQTFGLIAPIVGSVVFIIMFLIMILVVGEIAKVSDRPDFWNDLADFMTDYAWLFFGLILLGAFQIYFYTGYRRTFKWVNPTMSAIGFVGWLWTFAQIINLAGVDGGHPRLVSLSDFIVDALPVVFILAVIVGYMIVFFSLVSPANWDTDRKA